MTTTTILESLNLDWPEAALESVTTIFEHQGCLPAAEAAKLCELLDCNVGELARQLLPVAESLSIPSVSGFSVGCIAMGNQPDSNGMPDLFLGCNIEFPEAPLTTAVHAEQCVSAIARYHGQVITSLVLNITPCGHCRQFLNEFTDGQPLPVQIADKNLSLAELLPESFGPDDLIEKTTYQRAPERAVFGADYANEVELVELGLAQSYTPYSQQPVACTLNFKGNTVTGFAIENLASRVPPRRV